MPRPKRSLTKRQEEMLYDTLSANPNNNPLIVERPLGFLKDDNVRFNVPSWKTQMKYGGKIYLD